MTLFAGSEPLIALQLPADTRISSDQVLHFPQPPSTPDEDQQGMMQTDEEASTGTLVFPARCY